MSQSPFFIRKINQKNNHVFAIEWSDGIINDYRLSDIQKQCPCASCVDEVTGQRFLNKNSVQENVRAVSIKNVGRYALRIQFTHGCSLGIYSLNFLRQIANEKTKK